MTETGVLGSRFLIFYSFAMIASASLAQEATLSHFLTSTLR